MPITFLAGPTPIYPDRIDWHGATLYAHNVRARNVRIGDVVTFADCTGRPGDVAPMSFGTVTDTESIPAGTGRRYVAPWRRRELHVQTWESLPGRRGLQSWQMPMGPLTFAHTDTVRVYRPKASGPTRVKRTSY